MDPDDKERLITAHQAWLNTKRHADEVFYGLIGEWFRGPKRRNDNGELAQALGVSVSQLQRWARGESSGNRKKES